MDDPLLYEAKKALERIASYSPESAEEWALRLVADLVKAGEAEYNGALDSDAVKYCAKEDPNIIIRTWY